jgi:hypothetical protein
MAWQAIKSLSFNLPIFPCILLVFNTSLLTFNENIAELKSLTLITEIMQNFKQYSKAKDVNINLKAYFYSICVFGLNLSISLVKCLYMFQKQILSILEEVRVLCQLSQIKFCFKHFKTLLSLALEYFYSTITVLFLFI